MTPCTPAPPCDTEYPLLCEPLEITGIAKRLIVEDSAACQKTIQTPPTGQIVVSNNGTISWSNGENNTILSKALTGSVDFVSINSILQNTPIDLGSQPLTTTGSISAGNVTATGINTTGNITAGGNVTAAGINTTGSITAGGNVTAAGITANGITANGNVTATGTVTAASVTLGADPTTNLQATTKQYVDAANALKLNKAGDTMTGALIVNSTISSNSTILATGNSSKIGYGTGAGGSVTQDAGAKTNSVTLNCPTGIIVTDTSALAGGSSVGFNLINSIIEATDLVLVSHISGGTLSVYNFAVTPSAGSAYIIIRNLTPGSLSEALTLRFIVIKSVNV
jgi:hypothetical protein